MCRRLAKIHTKIHIHEVIHLINREHKGSVVECLTRDQGAAGSSLTGVTSLCP